MMENYEALSKAKKAIREMEALGLNTDRLTPLMEVCERQEEELVHLRMFADKDRLEALRQAR